MPGLYDQIIDIPLRTLPVIFVVNRNAAMHGYPIAAINEGIREAVAALNEIQMIDAEIKVGVLSFSNNAHWELPELVPLNDFHFNDLSADGLTFLHPALQELERKLHYKTLLQSEAGLFLPVIIFTLNTTPADNYENALMYLKKTSSSSMHGSSPLPSEAMLTKLVWPTW